MNLFGESSENIVTTESVHFMSTTDEWTTPNDLFKDLDKEFNFTLDPCCSKETAKCDKFYTIEDNGLFKGWSNETVFMNPPYSDISRWIAKAYNESQKGATVVCLIPSRTDTKWWHRFCMKADEIRFIKGRLKFGNSENNAPFPSAIIVFK